MSEAPLVEIDGLWKGFRRELGDEQRSLAGQLWRLFWGVPPREEQKDASLHWALRDVSARVSRGEVLGVIGHNGAGKTTLLRVLMGEMTADLGQIVSRGRVCGLIDMLAGFNQALTGRENIYVRGGYLGFSQRELAAIEQQIVDFADIGDFIDSPMHTYSQGMKMRLGFAVTTAVDADIMVIDEILAVGDFSFYNKCMAKMNELRGKRAIVLCSHSLEMIAQFADEAILLDRGHVAYQGDPAVAIETYRRLEAEKARGATNAVAAAASPSDRRRASVLAATRERPAPSPRSLPSAERADAPNQIFAPPAELLRAETTAELAEGAADPATWPGALRAVAGEFIYNRAAVGDVALHWKQGDDGAVWLTLDFTPLRAIKRLVVGVPIWTAKGVMVTGFGSHAQPLKFAAAGAPQRVELRIPKLRLNRGVYYPVVTIIDGTEYLYRWPMAPLDVLENEAALVWGLMTTEYEWLHSERRN